MDTAAQQRGLENLTTARDMSDMLTRIYRGQMISDSASREMLRILTLRSARTDPAFDYLGRQLVPRPTIAHLNGTLTGVRDDAGIIEDQHKAFVVAIFTRGQQDESGAEDAIASATHRISDALEHAQ
jgi:beta-lactamase class A